MMHEYSKQLDAAFVKAAAIQQTLNDAGLPLAMADEVLAELFTALEELLVSEEELNAQKRALEVAHATALTERRRYYELFDFAPDGYLVTDVNGVIQEANQAAVSMIGIDSYYLVGKPLVTYIVLDQRQRFLEQLRNVRTQYMPLRWETRMKPRHLPEFDVAITLATATHEASPKSRQLRWLLRDISERKQLEAQEREQYFRLTFEQSGVGMAHIGPKGEFTRVNQKLCSLLGYTPDALKTKRFRDVIHPDDLAPSVEAHQQLLSGRLDQAALDTRYVREDGSVVWTIATLSAVYSAAGQFHYNVLVVEDITERKQIEMAEREQRLITETLHQIALVLTSSLKFSEVIDHILNTIGRVVPHDAAVLMLLENGVATIVRSRGYDTDLHSLSVSVAEVDVLRTMAKSLCPL